MVAVAWALISEQYARLHQSYSNYQQTAAQDRSKTADKITRACADLEAVAFSDCITNRVETYYRQQATNQDLKAQQDMAFWGKWMFYASFGALGATVGGIWLVYLNLREARRVTVQSIKGTNAARKAVKVAKRQADLQEESFRRLERPYVMPGTISRIGQGPDERVPQKGANYVHCEIGNHGRTPAIIHYVLDSFGPTPNNHHSDPDSGVRKLPRDFARGSVMAAGEVSETLFVAEFPGAIKVTGKPGRLSLSYPDGDGVYLVINIKFEDVVGTIRIARFTWQWSGMYQSFLRYGGKKYNYEIEVDE